MPRQGPPARSSLTWQVPTPQQTLPEAPLLIPPEMEDLANDIIRWAAVATDESERQGLGQRIVQRLQDELGQNQRSRERQQHMRLQIQETERKVSSLATRLEQLQQRATFLEESLIRTGSSSLAARPRTRPPTTNIQTFHRRYFSEPCRTTYLTVVPEKATTRKWGGRVIRQD